MIEHKILQVFVNNAELYDKYHNALNTDFIQQNFPVLSKLFRSLPAASLTELEANYLANYPVLKDGDREAVQKVLVQIKRAEASDESVVKYLESHLARAWASNIAFLALDVAEGRSTVDKLDEEVAKRESVTVAEEEVEYVTTDINELIKQEVLEPGLTWRLQCLNQALGTLRKGNLGHIFARTETGKTAMWVSEVTHMASQVKRPILIFFNEEGGEDVVWRMYSAMTGMSYEALRKDPKRAWAIWQQRGGENIKFIDEPAQVEKSRILARIEEHDPELIVIDNADKTKGFSGDRKDLVLHEIYKFWRDIAKTQCPVLTIGQADNSSHNTMVLDESQLADSKTAKPSEMDFIIGIGRTNKDGYEDVRYISLPKNKLRGNSDTVESMRHMKAHQVMIVPHLSIYKDT